MTWLTRYFLNERLLFGALAGVLPIAIHLFNRARFDVRGWGAMMFLQASVDAKANRIRVQQFVLLALRCLFFAILAIALSRPIAKAVSGSDDSAAKATSTVLIIDTSGSTRYEDNAVPVFENIRQTALSIINQMGADDDLFVVRMGTKSEPLYPAPLSNKDLIASKVAALEPGYGKAKLSDALSEGMLALNQSTKPRRQIIILTDGQSASWPTVDSPQWEDGLKAKSLLKVKPSVYVLPHRPSLSIPNIRITGIRQDFPIVDVYRRNRFTVELVNGGGLRRTRLDLYVGGVLESEREVDLKPGLNAVSFDVAFNEAGPNYLRATIPSDGLAADNSCVLATQVVQRIPILLIEGRSNPQPLSSDGGCLRMALSAAGNAADSLFDVTVKNQTAMDRMDSAYLNQHKSVILANVTSLSMRFRVRLERYVQQGGGLFIALGPNVDPDNYNLLYRDDGGLLPAYLEGSVPKLEASVIPVIQSRDNPLFSNVDLRGDSLLEAVRIRKFHLTTAAKDAEVLASCNEFPLLVKKFFGKGQVVLWTTTASLEWSNMPMTEDFLPLMQNTVVTLSNRINPPINLGLGEALFYSTRPKRTRDLAQSRQARLDLPGGDRAIFPITFDDGQWVGSFEDTLTPGLYAASVADEQPTYYAVQIDRDEGDLSPLDDDLRTALTTRLDATFCSDLKDLSEQVSEAKTPNELWLIFLILALLLLSVELTLGHRYS